MNIELRPYQISLKNKAKEAFKHYKRVILLAPCRKWKNCNSKFNNAGFNK